MEVAPVRAASERDPRSVSRSRCSLCDGPGITLPTVRQRVRKFDAHAIQRTSSACLGHRSDFQQRARRVGLFQREKGRGPYNCAAPPRRDPNSMKGCAQRWKSGSLQPVLVFGLDEVRCLPPILQDP